MADVKAASSPISSVAIHNRLLANPVVGLLPPAMAGYRDTSLRRVTDAFTSAMGLTSAPILEHYSARYLTAKHLSRQSHGVWLLTTADLVREIELDGIYNPCLFELIAPLANLYRIAREEKGPVAVDCSLCLQVIASHNLRETGKGGFIG